MAFPKVLASVHCFTLFTQQSCLKSLNTIFLMHISMLTTHSYISASDQRMECHLKLMSYMQAMERCIQDIRHWMVSDRLLLNDDKTGFLLIGTRKQLNEVESLPSRVGTTDVEPVSCVRNLGVWFDSTLSMATHINRVRKSGFYYLHNLRRVRKYLFQDCLFFKN